MVLATGRQETERLLGTVVGQYRRLLSTTAVKAQALCLLARVGLIIPAAREAARRRDGDVYGMGWEEGMYKY